MPRLWRVGPDLRQDWYIRRVPVLFGTGLDIMLIQITHDDFVFSLDGRGWLTISGQGKNISHRSENMTADGLKGFAEGWATAMLYVNRDSDLVAAPLPAFQ